MINLKFTLLIIAFNIIGSAAHAADMPQDHMHGLDRCTQCHLEGVDISPLLEKTGNCQSCHDQTSLTSFVERLAKGDFVQQTNPRPRINTPTEQPIYYNETKFGDAPHPMIRIPAGRFIMGTNERLSDEGPQHTVELAEFWIDQYEVNNIQYKKFIDQTGHRSPSHFRNRSYPEGKVDHPVTFVSWHDAEAYCAWAGKRLPSDQEWEKAARGDDGRTYPWGNEFDSNKANSPLRWQKLGQFGDTLPIGMFPDGMSPYGLHDMSGNVWEWTSSWYIAYPDNQTASENYGERYKTLKGGSWFDCSFYKCGISAPVFNRAFFAKKVRNDTFGFRCAKNAD